MLRDMDTDDIIEARRAVTDRMSEGRGTAKDAAWLPAIDAELRGRGVRVAAVTLDGITFRVAVDSDSAADVLDACYEAVRAALPRLVDEDVAETAERVAEELIARPGFLS